MLRMSTEKLKVGIFNNPRIRELINDPSRVHSFVGYMSEGEGNVWISIVWLSETFWTNHKAQIYSELVN